MEFEGFTTLKNIPIGDSRMKETCPNEHTIHRDEGHFWLECNGVVFSDITFDLLTFEDKDLNIWVQVSAQEHRIQWLEKRLNLFKEALGLWSEFARDSSDMYESTLRYKIPIISKKVHDLTK